MWDKGSACLTTTYAGKRRLLSFVFFLKSTMDLIFDTPAIDLLDYGQDDGMESTAYFWQTEELDSDEFNITPAYFG